MAQLRFSALSAQRQSFVRRCQEIGFGKINDFAVREGELVMLPETEVLVDVKLDSEDMPRPGQGLKDFVLPAEVVRLFARMDSVRDCAVDHVEVRAGLPRRIVFKSRVLS